MLHARLMTALMLNRSETPWLGGRRVDDLEIGTAIGQRVGETSSAIYWAWEAANQAEPARCDIENAIVVRLVG